MEVPSAADNERAGNRLSAAGRRRRCAASSTGRRKMAAGTTGRNAYWSSRRHASGSAEGRRLGQRRPSGAGAPGRSGAGCAQAASVAAPRHRGRWSPGLWRRRTGRSTFAPAVRRFTRGTEISCCVLGGRGLARRVRCLHLDSSHLYGLFSPTRATAAIPALQSGKLRRQPSAPSTSASAGRWKSPSLPREQVLKSGCPALRIPAQNSSHQHLEHRPPSRRTQLAIKGTGRWRHACRRRAARLAGREKDGDEGSAVSVVKHAAVRPGEAAMCCHGTSAGGPRRGADSLKQKLPAPDTVGGVTLGGRGGAARSKADPTIEKARSAYRLVGELQPRRSVTKPQVRLRAGGSIPSWLANTSWSTRR